MCHLMPTYIQNLSWLHHYHTSLANSTHLGDQTETLYIMFMCRKLQEFGRDLSFKLHMMFHLMPTCAQNLPYLVHQYNSTEYDTHLGDQTKSYT